MGKHGARGWWFGLLLTMAFLAELPGQTPPNTTASSIDLRPIIKTISIQKQSWWTTAEPFFSKTTIEVPAPRHWALWAGSTGFSSIARKDTTGTSASSIVESAFRGPEPGLPADPSIAAGSGNFMVTTNDGISIYDTSGNFISFSTFGSFFQDQRGATFDAHVIYDQPDGRFMIVGTVRRDDIQQGHLDFAVSTTSDPLGTWNKYQLQSDNGNWSDFPAVGLSPTAVYITSDEITFAQPSSAQERLLVISLADLLAGASTLNISAFPTILSNFPGGGAFIPAMTYGSSDFEYFLGNGDSTHIRLFSIPTNGTPTLSETDILVPSYSFSPRAVQPGGTLTSGGLDLLSLVWRNGFLWATQTVADANGAPVVRWYRIDTASKSLADVGEVAGAGNAYFGAITVLPDNSALLVYSTSSSTQPVSGGYAARRPDDPPGTMPISGIYLQGSGGVTISRWGDFSTLSADPSGAGAWGMVEYFADSAAATAIVHLGSPSTIAVGVTVSPSTATLASGGTQQFTASVQNASDNSVSWSVDGVRNGDSSVGMISDSGLYTAPSGGTHQVTVTSNFDSSKSAVAVVVVAPAPAHGGNPDFVMSTSPTALAVVAGGSATTTVEISSVNGFQDHVSLSCSGLPKGASCSFSTLSATNQAARITTTGNVALLKKPATSLAFSFTIFVPFALLMLGGISSKNSSSSRFTRFSCLIALTCLMAAALGCRGLVLTGDAPGQPVPPTTMGTPVGAYTITLVGTSGSLQHSSVLTLRVQ